MTRKQQDTHTTDVTVYHTDGRIDRFENVSDARSRDLEDLPFATPTISRVDAKQR